MRNYDSKRLHFKKKREFLKFLFCFLVGLTFLGALLVTGVFWYFSRNLSEIIQAEDYRPLGVTRVLAPGGIEVGEFYKERRYVVPYEKIPSICVQAFVAAEDDRFFQHSGINLVSIIRAGIVNLKAGHVVQGGSTITQQVAKSLLLVPERSFDRKFKEIILANKIERNLTKQQILYLYLNQIYLGHGAYGVQAASRVYFKKDVSQLNLAEVALLAGMPQAPGKYSPHLNPKRAKDRQTYVLRRMLEDRYITSSQMQQAVAEPIKIYYDENLNLKYAPYYLEHLRKYLIEKYGEKAVYEQAMTLEVPMQPHLAQVAQKQIQKKMHLLDQGMGYRGPLKHLKGLEIEEFLKTSEEALLSKSLKYQVFLPNGTLSLKEALIASGKRSSAQLLEVDGLYQAVVMDLDEVKKVAFLKIGRTSVELPLDKMRWARAIHHDETVAQPVLSLRQVLQVGDVVWVRVLDNPSLLASSFQQGHAKKSILVALDQKPLIQGALFSLDVHTGSVLSMVGGYDFELSEFNRATQANRQIGSAIKPVIYACGLEKGFTPASIIVDSPLVFKDASGASWKPSNFEEKFYGDTTFRQAFIKSRNIPTLKIVQSIQLPYFIDYAKRLGLGALQPDLSISLGSASMSLMELTRLYALFPRLGRRLKPLFFTKLMDRDGRLLEAAQSEPAYVANAEVPSASSLPKQPVFPHYPLDNDPEQVLDPRVAYVMTHLMKEVVSFGTGSEAKHLGRVAAGKTGTTNDFMDAWFIGFTPEVVTGVWVGFDTQTSIGPSSTGARVALPIWLEYMKEAIEFYPDHADFPMPSGIVFEKINPTTGKPVGPKDPGIQEAFIAGTQPSMPATTQTEEYKQEDFFKEDRD